MITRKSFLRRILNTAALSLKATDSIASGETRRTAVKNRAVPERDEHAAELFVSFRDGSLSSGARRVSPDAIEFVRFADVWGNFKGFVFVFSISILFVDFTRAQSFTPELYRQFVEMRVGTGEPVYWYCIGEIYEYPGGKLIAKVEGVDTARLIKAESSAAKSLQLSRKIFFYRDATTNEVLREANGQKVEPIAYPYQQITYELKDGKLLASVVQGKAPRVQTIASSGQNFIRQFGGGVVFSLPLFLNFPTFQAYENYDFFRYPKAQKGVPQYQLSWNRRGNLPAFFGGVDSVFQLASYRVDKYADLPKTLRDVLELEARLWMNPPKDLKEIEELQKP